jgi:putative flippase GtrA
MLKRFVFLLAVLLLAPRLVVAQTVSTSLVWSHVPDTLAHVNGYTFTQKIDAAAATVITPTCVAAGANVNCSTPIVLTPGNHTIVVTATNAAGTASGTLNYVAPASPTQPVSIAITIQITVP